MARTTRYDEPLSVDDLTKINLLALGDTLKQAADADGVFSRIPAVDVPHVKRCIRAGIVVPAGSKPGFWKVTPDGYVMLRAYKYI